MKRQATGNPKAWSCALCLILLTVFVPTLALGVQWPANREEAAVQLAELNEYQPEYEAQSALEFHIRNVPIDTAYWLIEVPAHKTVEILLYSEDWCVVKYRNVVGYAKTGWLRYLRSLDPYLFQVPGLEKQTGIATVLQPVSAAVDQYTGNTFAAGDIVSVQSYEKNEAEINMMRSKAALPAGMLSFQPFTDWQNAQPGDCIAAYTTYYNESVGGDLAENRRYNIELAVQRVHGATLTPGAIFSFNALCGPYSKGNSYQIAPNISKSRKGYGGGVCQLTTTLYNAILHLPLQVEQWRVHRASGVDYIQKGFDAAVGSLDFTFINTLSYPITISALSQNGVLTVLITRAEPISN